MSNNYLDITIYDFDSICRTCLSREDLKPLYDKCSRSTCLAEMLMTFTFLKFTEDDGLPMKICTNCIHEINQAFSFTKRCETTDAILRNCIKKIKTELENNSSESQTVEEAKEVLILPNIRRTVHEVLGDYKCVEVKIESVDEVKKEEELIIENDDPADEGYEVVDENQVEMYSEKSDYPGSKPGNKSTNSQIEKESLKEKDCTPPAKKLDLLKKKVEPIIETKGKMESKSEVFGNYEFVEVKQEEELILEDECDENYDNSAYESFEEGVETYFEKSDTPSSRPNSAIEEENSPPAKRLAFLKADQRINPEKRKGCKILRKDFQCKACDAKFKSKASLRKHSTIHRENKFLCGVCRRSFADKILLDYHSKVHTGEKTYDCLECGKSFSFLGTLTKHHLIHTGAKPHVCSVCSKAFNQSSSLKAHMRIHTGEKPYTCVVCSMAFNILNNLNRHMRLHTGEKRYACAICDETFYTKSAQIIHERIHTGEKPYICPICGKGFRVSSTMLRHKRIHCRPL